MAPEVARVQVLLALGVLERRLLVGVKAAVEEDPFYHHCHQYFED